MIEEKLMEITQGLLNKGYLRGELKLPMDKENSLLNDQAISRIKALVIESLGEAKIMNWEENNYNSGYTHHIVEMVKKWK